MYHLPCFALYFTTLLACSIPPQEPRRQTGYITMADSKIYYEVSGRGEPILFLHGGLQDRRMWDGQIAEFSKTYTVITCDQRGHGLHVDGDSSYYMYEGLRRLLDTLKITKTHVVGLSMGGAVATDFAVHYPRYTRKLVLVTPGLNTFKPLPKEDSILIQGFGSMRAALNARDTMLAAEYFIRIWFDGPRRTPAQSQAQARKKALMLAGNAFKTHRNAHWARLDESEDTRRYKKITAPTLLIVGDQDNPIIARNVDTLATYIPRRTVVMMRDVAHMPNMEKPGEFNRMLAGFLKD